MSNYADAETALRERLDEFPADRYPMQHATASFHLGSILAADPDRLDEAEEALMTAATIFEPRVGVEAAKAVIGLGAVLRAKGELERAAEAFEQAAAEFREQGEEQERGAALFNLGLVRRDQEDLDGALEAFEEARELLPSRATPRQAAAVARELGTTLFLADRTGEADEVLEEACDLARRSGDQEGLGGAANVLGLVRLGAGDHEGAAEAITTAVRSHPRSLRPGPYAMAKANLALAREAQGDTARARLAARQARDIGGVAPPVSEQAEELLERIGDDGEGGLVEVLDTVGSDARQAVVRDELGRWTDLEPSRQRGAAGAFVDAVAPRGAESVDLIEALLRGMLEMPGDAMEDLAGALVDACAERESDVADEFRSRAAQGMARFHAPQFMRLKDTFNALAEKAGEPADWG